VPVDEAARLLRDTYPSIAEQLARIPVATVESTAVVVPKPALGLRPLAGLVAREAPFYSVVSRDVVPDMAWRGFAFHCRPGVDEEQRVTVAAQVLEVTPDVFQAVRHTRHRLPSLRLGHGARMEAIDHLLQGEPLALAGNYFSGLSLEDCALRASREAKRLGAAERKQRS
jgi:hypothetical protein